MRLIADIFLLAGAVFIFLGALGLIRMPDVYNRIQAGTKAVTLGAMSVFIGLAFLFPQWWHKLLVIMGFILLTSPVSSSAIARAFYVSNVRPWSCNEGSCEKEPEDFNNGDSNGIQKETSL